MFGFHNLDPELAASDTFVQKIYSAAMWLYTGDKKHSNNCQMVLALGERGSLGFFACFLLKRGSFSTL